MFGGIVTIVGGILCSSSLIIAKKPNAKELIDKLVPYQGWVGVLLLFWGVWEIIGSVTSIGLLGIAPIYWIFWLVSGIIDFLMGVILGFGLVSKWTMSGSPEALAKGQALRGKLVLFQIPIGIAGIIMGILYIVFWVLARAAFSTGVM